MEKRQGGQIVFDLVEGDHETGQDDGRDGPAPGGGEVVRGLWRAFLAGAVRARGWVSRHRGASLVATGAAAAVALTAAGLGTVHEQDRVALLRTAPGGVESLAAPPVAVWRYEPGGDTDLLGRSWFDSGPVAMGGNAVFLEGEQSAVNRSRFDAADARVRWREAALVAVDVRSGEESWRVPLGVDPVCTRPTAGGPSHALDEIVCLVGEDDDRATVVVSATGQASAPRPLAAGPPDTREELLPAGNGLLVRARPRGDAPRIDCADASVTREYCTVSGDGAGWSVVVLAEDARTGREVWRAAVPWDENLLWCRQTPGGTRGSRVDAGAVSLWSGRPLVFVSGCGVSESFGTDGTRVAGPATPVGAGGLVVTEEYRGGAEGTVSTVRTADGETLLTTTGWLTGAATTDGTPVDTLVVREADDRALRGFDLRGSPAWTLEEATPGLVARLGHVGFLRRSDGGGLALDLRSGTTLWERSADDLGIDASGEPLSAFTDGRTVMQVERAGPPDRGADVVGTRGDARLVAFDVAAGRVRWEAAREDTAWFAVDGRLLSVTADGSLVGYDG